MWAHVSAQDIGRSDFTSTYVGATLLRSGHRADLYADSVQAAVHARLIAPDREGNLPFVDAPIAAALAAPVTLLSLDSAYRVWGLIQVGVLVAAVLIALSSAPWPVRTPRLVTASTAIAAVAGAGTFVLLVQAQWTSVSALGLALAYRDWRHDRLVRGAMFLTVSAGVAKPHLALALVAFMAGWRSRRVLAGALAGAGAVAAASVLLVGFSGLQGFALALTSSATRWDLATFVSFIGLPATVLGSGGAAQAAGVAGSVLLCGAAFCLGALIRADRGRLEPALAGAATLSLLAAPHALLHDTVLLAPALVWSVAWAMRRSSAVVVLWGRVSITPVAVVATCALLVTAAGLATVGGGALAVSQGGALAPGAIVTPALLLAAAAAVAATRTPNLRVWNRAMHRRSRSRLARVS